MQVLPHRQPQTWWFLYYVCDDIREIIICVFSCNVYFAILCVSFKVARFNGRRTIAQLFCYFFKLYKIILYEKKTSRLLTKFCVSTTRSFFAKFFDFLIFPYYFSRSTIEILILWKLDYLLIKLIFNMNFSVKKEVFIILHIHLLIFTHSNILLIHIFFHHTRIYYFIFTS